MLDSLNLGFLGRLEGLVVGFVSVLFFHSSFVDGARTENFVARKPNQRAQLDKL